MIWTREQAKALTDRALSFSKAEETQVTLTGGVTAVYELNRDFRSDAFNLRTVLTAEWRP